jgi:hypothetical protein
MGKINVFNWLSVVLYQTMTLRFLYALITHAKWNNSLSFPSTIEVTNPLKTERICFILGLSAYRAVNTLHFGYKNQSLNVL